MFLWKKKELSASDYEAFADASTACCRKVRTTMGPLVLRDCCSPELITELRADSGLHAFARVPEREHQLLLEIAGHTENKLTLAYTETGDIVGEVTLAPAGSWWRDQEPIYEIAVEVSSSWRRRGIAQQLLRFALELEALEEMIVIGLGFYWHWDTSGLGLPVFRYREMIAKLFGIYGFSEYLTTEPNIATEPANILLVRLGQRVEQEVLNRFFERLFQSNTLPGLS